jgi:hypothetical protein
MYPQPCEIPKDPADPRFTLSFDVTPLLPPPPGLPESERLAAEKQAETLREEIQRFYDVYGFVVFSNVLNEDECSATEAEIWVSE